MIGEASMTCRASAGPASTGQQPMFSQAATSGCAHSGGSVMERNAPPDTVMIMCAATSAAGSACSRAWGRRPPPACVSFVTCTVSRAACQGPASGVARTDTDPASGSRRRATRAPASVSCSSPPGTRTR